jgi:hypothetical protein
MATSTKPRSLAERRALNYNLELRSHLEWQLLSLLNSIREQRTRRTSWEFMVKWLIGECGVDDRLTDKKLMSFCRRHDLDKAQGWSRKT